MTRLSIFSKQRKVKCPDGIKYVYRNPADAFPMSVLSAISTSVQGAVDGLEALSASANVERKREIDTVLFQLDESNRSLQADFAAAYIVFASDPCHDPGYLQRRITELQIERAHLSEYIVRVRLLERLLQTEAPATDVTEMIRELLSAAKPRAAIEARDLITDAPRIVGKWVQP